ncbi:hypothetical protein PVAND_009742 [Polypedilum vanderplanki]|uniref:Uncharacterized protein n=1 Tax=Polypedilum vanderplanki TaxID=319348 RepID=A0A9J6CDF8_POLVA|nr:hypothetical protein PVAND_009742 [Polypedilum vanderplanki]
MKLKEFFFLFQFALATNAYMHFIFYETIHKCSNEYEAGEAAVDFSKFKYIPVNDTHTFINGSLKFLVDVNPPWKIRYGTERKYGSIWDVTGYDKTYRDLCAIMWNPMEPPYIYTKKQQKCPYKAGTEWKFDKEHFKIEPEIRKRIPKDYEGEWRGFFIMTFNVDGKNVEFCRKSYVDTYWENEKDVLPILG